MAKFKIRFKVEKLEMEIEGERENLRAITKGLKENVAGLIQAPATVVGVEVEPEPPLAPVAVVTGNGDDNPRRRRRNRTSGGTTSEDSAGAAIDFRHDAGKFGNPKQEWTTAQKAMWLLFVVSKQTEHKELNYNCITATFNKHFRQSGAIRRPNVFRDLGKAKTQNPPPVGEDTTKSPSLWYLTDEGIKTVQKLSGELSLAS